MKLVIIFTIHNQLPTLAKNTANIKFITQTQNINQPLLFNDSNKSNITYLFAYNCSYPTVYAYCTAPGRYNQRLQIL